MRALGADESADWRCPLCDVGIPVGQRAACSRQAFRKGKDKHRRQAHRRLSPEAYAKRCRKAGSQKVSYRMKKRVEKLNESRLQRGRT